MHWNNAIVKKHSHGLNTKFGMSGYFLLTGDSFLQQEGNLAPVIHPTKNLAVYSSKLFWIKEKKKH